MKRILTIVATLLFSLGLHAQDYSFITDLPDDFSFLDTVPQKQRFFNEHLLGVQYSLNLAGVSSSPNIGQARALTYKNIGVYYTFYHVLWDKLANFGLQVGAKLGYEGYNSELEGYGEICRLLEFPLISQFHLDFSAFRVLINAGTYYGYRLSTDKIEGFDQYDQRHDYGLLAGGGLAVVFKPMEFHIEANYKFGLASMYQTNKFSDLYWMFTYPRTLSINAGIFIHLEKKRK